MHQPQSAQFAANAAAYWSVVIPVKVLQSAKTRVQVADPRLRSALARAMALDTIEVAVGCATVGEVIVVTDEQEIAAAAHALSAVVVDDAPAAGLNAALDHGAAVARERRAECGVTALAADLPAMKPAELARVLELARDAPRTAVPDAAGAGTVVLTARAGVDLEPTYGEDSLARHQEGGAVVLGVDVLGADVPGLRRDVDTLSDLRAALWLGCGPRTTAVAADVLSGSSEPN